MSTTVHVENIHPKTSEQEVKDFFAFWYVPHALIRFKSL